MKPGPAGARWARTAVAVLALAGGCGSEDGTSIRRYTVGDTIVVESLRPLIPDTLLPVEVSRYGRAEGPPEYLFDRVFVFAVGPEGSVFVDVRGEGIRQYSSDGEFIGRTAGYGEGPSEVGYALGMDVSSDARVAVVDGGNRRLSVFSPGTDTWSTRLPDGRSPRFDGAVAFRDDGSLWMGFNPMFPEAGGITHPRAVFVRVNDEGVMLDTLFTPGSIAYHCPALSSWEHQRGFWEDNREPYLPKVKWALGRDGTFVVGCTASYRFYVYSTDGQIMRVARARTPVRVSGEERAFRAAMPVPEAEETLPAYAKITLPGDGRIWVWPSHPSVKVALDEDLVKQFGVTHTWSIPEQGAFDVFTADGEWLAVVKLPPRAMYSGFPTAPGIVIRGDTIWAVERDDFDIETVVRYEVSDLRPRDD